MTHLSLFTGIGGLDLAAEWAGFETVGQCEWADYPTKVLERHWPEVERWRDTMDKIDKAVERLKIASEMSLTYYGEPLIVTYSGGKDSDVCLALAKAAGIPYEVLHNHTTADAPETVYHIRETFKRLEGEDVKCTVKWPAYKGKSVTMWTLIPQNLMPPTRFMRYCCSVLKEGGGAGRMICTGVRWAEAARRKNSRGIYETSNADKSKRIILSNDNDDRRRLFEDCKIKSKRVVNPIIDWSTQDVLEYAAAEKIKLNPLYRCGFGRVGCVGCPMSGKRNMIKEFARYPTYERAYIRAFDAMLAERRRRRMPTEPAERRRRWMPTDWQTGVDVMHWWLDDGVLPGQMEIEEIGED